MALEPVKYGAFGSEIESAWQGVVRGGEEWVVLSARGDGELEPRVGDGFGAFLGEFGDQVAYGLARVTPPGSDVEKLLLVGWCPDTAPMKARASFAANFGTVANNVLKGYHVQVTARDEDDLDEQELLMKISNAAGARYPSRRSPRRPLKPHLQRQLQRRHLRQLQRQLQRQLLLRQRRRLHQLHQQHQLQVRTPRMAATTTTGASLS